MPLIMGILAQAAAAPGPTPGVAAYDLLETEILTGTTTTVSFSGLVSAYAADYQHLQIRATFRSSRNIGTNSELAMQINGATSGYSWHVLVGNGSSVSSDGASSQTHMRLSGDTQATDSANIYAAMVCDILDPFDTNKFTTFRALAGDVDSNDSVRLSSGLYQATTAVDEIDMFVIDNAPTYGYVTGSRFSLYGLRKAA